MGEDNKGRDGLNNDRRNPLSEETKSFGTQPPPSPNKSDDKKKGNNSS